MPHLVRLLLATALSAAASAAVDTGGADDAADAYDLTMVQNGVTIACVLVRTHDQAAFIDTKAPETVRMSDQPTPGGPRWMPCTRAKDNSFTCTMSGMVMRGSFSHGQLSGSVEMQRQRFSFSGTRSPKHYRIVRPLDSLTLLAHASASLTAHDPKTAIDIDQHLIEDDRFDTDFTAMA